jgi:hypothetical protein
MDSKTSQQILDKVAAIKSAQNPGISAINKATRADAHNRILNMFLLSGATMGGLRGLQGVLNLAGRTKAEDIHHPGVTPVPIPISDDDEEKQAFHKQADPEAYKWWQHPEALPGMMAAGLGGGYGGWKVMDALLDRRRKSESEDELAAAKREYQEALSSHVSLPAQKAAAEKSAATLLGEELDALFVKVKATIPMEKFADPDEGNIFGATGRALNWLTSAPGKFYDWVRKDTTRDSALGMYGAYSIPTLLAGYMAGKGLSDKFSRKRILDKALKERSQQRAAARPPSLYAIPVDEDDES